MTKLRPVVRDRDGGKLRHLVDLDDPAGVALCGRPGPWSSPTAQQLATMGEKQLARCGDCATAHQMRTEHLGGRVWAGA